MFSGINPRILGALESGKQRKCCGFSLSCRSGLRRDADTLEIITREPYATEVGRQFARLFEDASRRKFDMVLFWALDRFSREGMVQTILHLQRLDRYGVKLHSYTESHLNTDNEL